MQLHCIGFIRQFPCAVMIAMAGIHISLVSLRLICTASSSVQKMLQNSHKNRRIPKEDNKLSGCQSGNCVSASHRLQISLGDSHKWEEKKNTAIRFVLLNGHWRNGPFSTTANIWFHSFLFSGVQNKDFYYCCRFKNCEYKYCHSVFPVRFIDEAV